MKDEQKWLRFFRRVIRFIDSLLEKMQKGEEV